MYLVDSKGRIKVTSQRRLLGRLTKPRALGVVFASASPCTLLLLFLLQFSCTCEQLKNCLRTLSPGADLRPRRLSTSIMSVLVLSASRDRHKYQLCHVSPTG